MTRSHGKSEEEYREAARQSTSIADMCRYVDIKPCGGNYSTIKKVIAKYNIDISHFLGHAHNKGKFLVAEPVSRATIKKRLIQSRGHKCETCQGYTWMGKKITLEVEHIDGNTENNDFSNLLLLCPNCHSLTPTWRRAKSSFGPSENLICPECNGKKNIRAKICSKCYRASSTIGKRKNANLTSVPKTSICECGLAKTIKAKTCMTCRIAKQKRIDWPSTDEIIKDVRSSSYLAVSRKLGVNDNSIRKYLRTNGIDPKTFEPMV